MRKQRKPQSESEIIIKLSERMTADELQKYFSSRFEDDLLFFKRVVTEEKERTDEIRSETALQPLLKEVKQFFDDLVSDGYVTKDLSLIKENHHELYIIGQQRDEARTILDELIEGKEKTNKEVLRKWNRLYVIYYETVLNSDLISLAEKISGKRITEKGKVLDKLKFYRNGRYADIFRSLIPQIRNSIQHRDFVIAPIKPEITFNDRNKPPLTLSMNEYYSKLSELIALSAAFDVATFDLEYSILKVLLNDIDVVYNFCKKHNLRFQKSKDSPLSLIDWASLIKSKTRN